jgi:hypothetical protein
MSSESKPTAELTQIAPLGTGTLDRLVDLLQHIVDADEEQA